MKKIFSPKFLLIVIVLSLIIFFIITSSQKLGTEIAKKHLSDYKERLADIKNQTKNLPENKLNRESIKKVCQPIIKTLYQDIVEFENHNLPKEVFQSYKLIYDCYQLSNQKDNVIKTLSKMIELEPQSHELHGKMAEALVSVNNLGMAQRSVHLAAQINPKHYQWKELEADILMRLEQYEKASDLYNEALSVAPYDKTNLIAKKLDNAISIISKDDLNETSTTSKVESQMYDAEMESVE